MTDQAQTTGKSEEKKQDDGSFAFLLKDLREKQNISQSRLAERAEFDHSYLSRLETGARMPSREAIDKIATALAFKKGDVEYDHLLIRANFMPYRITPLFASFPVLAEALLVLEDGAIPSEIRDALDQSIRLSTMMAKFYRTKPLIVA